MVLTGYRNLTCGIYLDDIITISKSINTFCQKVESLTTEKQSLKTELKKTFPEIFAASLGKCTKTAAKFKLIDNAQPVFKKKRNLPFASLEKIKKELDRRVKTGILSKVEFSQWAAPTVYVRKKYKEIGVCADFSTGLNAVLIDYHYPLPSPGEVFTKLNEGKIFSKVDLSDAYLQIHVEENSSKLLCINTRRGLFKLERLPFGIKVTPAIFQEVMDTMLDGLDFAIAYLDDIIIISKSKERHRKHVRRVFSRIQKFGFKVKEEKCEFFLEEIKYMSHVIDKDDRRLDPHRATAIKTCQLPGTSPNCKVS